MIELLLILAVFGIMTAVVTIPLGGLLTGSALREGETAVIDSLRRVVTQSMSGHYGDGWGVHFSDSDGCILPATKMHVFRGAFFTSATETIHTIDLPQGATISALAIGGGCDVKFSRFHGSTTSTGTVTVSNNLGETGNITVNQYGRILAP
jgi:type II secretory pathway pseudopilin PulG